jgi:cell division protein FtsQ
MAGMISVSRQDLAQRRQKLRRQRRLKIIQTIWRTFTVSSLAGGLLWVTLQPMWVLKTPTQVVMTSDNQLLPDQTIESLLALSYPQSLWRIQPSTIAETLKQQPAIADATVNRRLFPPGLIIEIQEKSPVAISYPSQDKSTSKCKMESHSSNNSGKKSTSSCSPNQTTQRKQGNITLLDANGALIPWEKYTVLNPDGKLPNLKVIGSPDQYRTYWTQLYQAVSQSSVKISEIDCQDPTNLILKTELGNVHLGVPSELSEKIQVLGQIWPLAAKLNPKKIAYIDIKNPHQPMVQELN